MNGSYRGFNYYDELGIDPSSAISEIKEAYRKLAREFHPDINPSEDARIRFANIQKAYQILSDARQRANHDMQLGVLREDREDGLVSSTQSLRRDLLLSKDETVEYLTARSQKKSMGFAETIKSLIPKSLLPVFQSEKSGPETSSNSKSILKERIYSFSISELEALSGTTRTIVLNSNGEQSRRELPIPPIDKSEKKLKIKLKKTLGAAGFDEVRIIVKVLPDPYIKRKDFDVYLTVPMLKSELVESKSMQLATATGMENINLSFNNIKSPLILSSCGLWDKSRELNGDIIIKAIEFESDGSEEKEQELNRERERVLFFLASLKNKFK